MNINLGCTLVCSPRARCLATRRAIKSDDVILADSAGECQCDGAGECQCGERDDIARARNDIERGCAFAMAATSCVKNKIKKKGPKEGKNIFAKMKLIQRFCNRQNSRTDEAKVKSTPTNQNTRLKIGQKSDQSCLRESAARARRATAAPVTRRADSLVQWRNVRAGGGGPT